jgi:hypothetical protein
MISQAISELIKFPQVTIKKRGDNFCQGKFQDEEGGSPVKFSIAWGADYIILQMNHKCLDIMQVIASEVGEPHLYWRLRSWTGMKHCIAWYNDENQRETLYNSLQMAVAMNRWPLGYKHIQKWAA